MLTKGWALDLHDTIQVAIRSYNRPKYLQETLDSISKSDLDRTNKIIIFDDGSNDKETLDILKRYDNNDSDNKYKVIYSEKNYGCTQSYLNLLKYIKQNIKTDYVCIVDNDIHVNKNWLNNLHSTYKEAEETLKTSNIVLSGFSPTNTHQYKSDQVKMYKNFHLQYSVGAVCYFFNYDYMGTIYKGWDEGQDWGISRIIKRLGQNLAVLNKGVVNHIGMHGINSSGTRYDYDKNFIEDED